MKKLKSLIIFLVAALLFPSCRQNAADMVQTNFAFAARQFDYAFPEIDLARREESEASRSKREKNGWGPLVNPRTFEHGKLELVPSKDWTSGFFPGSLWYMYEYTGEEKWKDQAERFTLGVEREKNNGITHDMGFKVYCSFGNGYRLTSSSHYRDVLMQAARTLITRYKPTAKIIRSWEHNRDKWECPVIIDNMMNLELLFWAWRESGDPVFYDVAVDHAQTTLKNHFREDYSTYHVIDYDTLSGHVLKRNTHQGYAHESTWSRGQAWAIYGYAMCYRETGKTEFLKQAERAAEYYFSHPNLPADLIPYWDFHAPGIPNEPRDVSAATVTASALYELSTYPTDKAPQYLEWANIIVENLSTDQYRVPEHTHGGFLLLHSTGSGAHNSEMDVPLVYADYYFLEALLRKKKLGEGMPLFDLQ